MLDDAPFVFVPFQMCESKPKQCKNKTVDITSLGVHFYADTQTKYYKALVLKLLNWEASSVTVSCFKQLLSFFGKRREKHDDKPVTPKEIVNFFNLFCGTSFGNKNIRRQFIKKFQLPKYFLKDQILKRQHIFYGCFCRFIQDNVLFWLAIVDGQHRSFVIQLLLLKCKVTNYLPTQLVSESDKYISKRSSIFCPMSVNFICNDECSFSDEIRLY